MTLSLPKVVLRLFNSGKAVHRQRRFARRTRLSMSDDQLRDIGILDGRRRRGEGHDPKSAEFTWLKDRYWFR